MRRLNAFLCCVLLPPLAVLLVSHAHAIYIPQYAATFQLYSSTAATGTGGEVGLTVEISEGPSVDFNRDIRPILSDNCFACHGPDASTRKAGLRLDVEADALAALKSGAHAIVPGKPHESEIIKRILTGDADDRMPPADFNKELSEAQIKLLTRWIEEGAAWQDHWAFVKPERPALPPVSQPDWVRNAIDHFVLARLDREGLAPSPEADERTLIRRLTLDLTGLPPTPEEVHAFLTDDSPEAYENAVDRLLASPHYGEHMARYWLDAARYADTNGYHIDNERYMWRWRDWVIDAFNDNKPFDEFSIEQIAGDLLPEPTMEQRLATGFHRNHMINFEGGAIPEEYHNAYVVDRVNTTAAVFLGLTMNCAQCHEHKYDPFTQANFYELYAFFNTVDEQGLDGRDGNSVPFMKAPLPEQEARQQELQARREALLAKLEGDDDQIDRAQRRWESRVRHDLRDRWTRLEAKKVDSAGGAAFELQKDGSYLVSGENVEKDVYTFEAPTGVKRISGIRLEAFTDDSLADQGPGRAPNGNFVLTEFEVELLNPRNPEQARPIKFARAEADFSQEQFPVSFAIDGKPDTGWAADGHNYHESRTALFVPERPFGFASESILRVRIKQESDFATHALGRFRISVTNDPALLPSSFGGWYHSGPYVAEDGNTAYETAYAPEQSLDLEATYPDGRMKWTRRPDFDAPEQFDLPGDVVANYLYRGIEAASPRAMTLSLGSNDAIKVWLNGEVVHDNNVQRAIEPNQDTITLNLAEGGNDLLVKVVNYGNAHALYFSRAGESAGGLSHEIESLAEFHYAQRSERQNQIMRRHFRIENYPAWAAVADEFDQINADLKQLEAEIPTSMVMAEMAEPRETFVLERGAYDQLGEKVEARVPESLHPMPEGAPNNRLGLAQWLMAPENPLTARVTINRYWERFFGRGLVKTAEDFGVQGAPPTHPQLLDWLAVEFVESGWDIKHMVRTIVTSAAYRQQSPIPPALLDRDPENRLLARGPRYRLDGEVVRDSALALSGLLNPAIGGPSVKPYQPEGIWEEVAYGSGFTAQSFKQDEGDQIYRRSMYTFWKRQAPPPRMIVFDAPNRETCTVQRERTNTPLQALALMNDPQFVEAARVLAQRSFENCGDVLDARIAWAFERATARVPTEQERALLADLYHKQRAKFADDEARARSLLGVGDSDYNTELNPADFAAMSTVTSIILNLDETITKS